MIALALLLGCTPETGLVAVEARLALTPPQVDLPPARVGDEVGFTVRLEHLQGDAFELLDVSVLDLGGAAFRFEGETDLGLSRGDAVDLPFVYAPTDAGFHAAALVVTTSAADGVFEVLARGRAVEPDLSVFPSALDFGPVAVGASGTATVRLDNGGLAALTVDAALSDTRFALGAVGPLEIAAGSELTVPLTFTALDPAPVSATLVLRVGDAVVGEVDLRANDCAAGAPALYDVDGDGWTACAGDCDDGAAGRSPGAAELPDGVDQDCDGVVDEGTAVRDDDGDGACEAGCTDGSVPGDCHDGDPAIGPLAAEIPGNGVDDDCDGVTDGGEAVDQDGDGMVAALDCDDANASVRPGLPELPDGLDNDCDTAVDEGTVLADDDGDGSCEALLCSDGSEPGDCDDTNADIGPDAVEVANFLDDDCDGLIDEGTVHGDDDGDGFTPAGGDCDDTDPLLSPALGTC